MRIILLLFIYIALHSCANQTTNLDTFAENVDEAIPNVASQPFNKENFLAKQRENDSKKARSARFKTKETNSHSKEEHRNSSFELDL